MTITEKINMFIESRDILPVTATSYRFIMKRFINFLVKSGMKVNNLEFQHVYKYKQHLAESGFSETTIRSHLAIIRCFSKFMKEENIGIDFAKAIKLPKKYKGYKRDPLSFEQIQRLITGITGSPLMASRATAIITLMLAHGLRDVEVSRLNVNDIRLVDNEMYIYICGKGRISKADHQPVNHESVEAIEQYLLLRGDFTDTDPLFVTHALGHPSTRLRPRDVSRIVSGQLRRVGLKAPNFTPHSLRHSTATHLLESGLSIYEVMRYMRHSNVSITELYVRKADEELLKRSKPQTIFSKLLKKPTNTSKA